jgi:hypothetical protein
MNTSVPQPTKVGSFTIWVIVALVALVIIAVALAMGGDDEIEPGQPVGLSMSEPHLRRA